MSHVNQRVRKERKAKKLDTLRDTFSQQDLLLEYENVRNEIAHILDTSYDSVTGAPIFGSGLAPAMKVAELEKLQSALYRAAFS
jgi:hypothetical protein